MWAFVMSDSSKFTGIVEAKQMNHWTSHRPLRVLEINHTVQSEENFIECDPPAKKQIEFMELYSGLGHSWAQASAIS